MKTGKMFQFGKFFPIRWGGWVLVMGVALANQSADAKPASDSIKSGEGSSRQAASSVGRFQLAQANKQFDNGRNNDTPVRDRDVKRNDAPVRDNNVKRIDAPVRDNNVKRNDAPVRDNTVKRIDAPVQDNNIKRNETPVQDKSAKHIDAPVKDKTVKHIDVPVDDKAAKHIDTPEKDKIVKHVDTPVNDKDVKRIDAPVKDKKVVIDKDKASDPKIRHDNVSKNNTLPPSGDRTRIQDVQKRLPPNGNGISKNLPPLDMQKKFSDQLKAGELVRLTSGETAKKLKLADQYRMMQKGDVARRLELEKHKLLPEFHHGPVSPAYAKQCLKYHYWGPAFFAGVCLYPMWNPWVEWSWHHHCPPTWDPRPIWCRPVIYAACPAWGYWRTPVWVALPVVSCGTWVDLSPVVIPAEQSDLQLVAVRFVDPGHPEEKLGPRYRVWFRNNGAAPITRPFNVMLFAGNDGNLSANLPQAGVRVTAIEAFDMQSVDIRLPVEVYTMGRDVQGNPAPFSTLHVLVDANQEIPEITKTNNGARLTPADILPVDPAAFELEPAEAKPGADVVLAGEGFGPQPGRVLLQVNGKEMDGEILGWYDLGVRLSLPKLAIAAPTETEVIIVRGDGAAANPLKITLIP